MKEWLRAGTIIGTYQILMRIGVSGLGEVYRARDEYQNIDGALKLLPSSLGWTEESARRFVEILKTSPVLQHQNISKVLDAGIDQDGRPYVVTEYVRGQSLDEIGIGLARTMAEKIHVVIQVADALEYAHQQGVLHLSLKPANVMLTSTGGVKVLDFVVALATQVALMLRGPNAPKIKPTIGSARYLSPEQVRGEKPTRQSDVFSLGTLCYELFTGQLPFSGRSAEEVTVAIVRDQPMSLLAYIPDAHPGLDTIILKALEKSLETRYKTAAEFSADLKALVANQSELQFTEADPNAKQQTSFIEKVKAAWRKLVDFLKQYMFQMLVGALLMAMALTSGLVFQYFQREDHDFTLPTGFTSATKVTSSGRVIALAFSPHGTSLAYVTENNSKRTLLYKELNDSHETVLGISPDADIKGLTFSIDGEWVYYVKDTGSAGELYVCSIRGGHSRKVLSDIAGPVTFSPNGKEFAFVRIKGTESQIVIAPTKTETQVRDKLSAAPAPSPKGTPTTEPPAAGKGVITKYVVATNILPESQRVLLSRYSPQFILPQSLSWSHDGTRLAALLKKPHNDLIPEIVSFNVQSGEEKTLSAAPGPEIEGLAWLSGDSSLLVNARALTNAQRQIWNIDLSDGKTRALTKDYEDFSGLGVSLDGAKAISIKTSRSVSIWLGQDDKALELTNNQDDGMSGFAWLDTKRIVHASRPGGLDTLWVTATDGTSPQMIKWARFGGVDVQRNPSVTNDGTNVVFEGVNGNSASIYQVELGDLSSSLKAQSITQSGAEFFPQVDREGKALFYTTFVNGRAALVRSDPTGGAATTLLDGKVWRFALSPDGQQLAANYFDESSGKWKIIIFPASGGQASAILDAPGNGWRALGWMPNSQNVMYIVTRNGVSNLWQQPAQGGTPVAVTSFSRQRLYGFAWSPDGKQLAVVRGRSNDDAVMLDELK